MSFYQDALRRRLNQNHPSGPKDNIKGVNRGRLHIAAPNPDPRPPNEPKPHYDPNKGRDNQSKGKDKGKNKGGVKPSSYSPAPSGGNGSQAPAEPLYGQPIDPRDSNYWRDVLTLQQNRNSDLREQDINATYSQTAFEEALSNMARQQPRDVLTTQENANRAGSFYSSKTGEAIGIIGQNYFQQEAGLRRSKEQEDSLRALTRNMIENGYTQDEAAAYAEAVDRQAQAEADRPAPNVQPIDISKPKAKKKKQNQNQPKQNQPKHKGKGKGK